jgi:hypothetical protein
MTDGGDLFKMFRTDSSTHIINLAKMRASIWASLTCRLSLSNQIFGVVVEVALPCNVPVLTIECCNESSNRGRIQDKQRLENQDKSIN